MYKALTHMLPYEEIKDTLDQIDRTGKTAEQVLEEEQHARMKYYTGQSGPSSLLWEYSTFRTTTADIMCFY